jgi:hypothetical protein
MRGRRDRPVDHGERRPRRGRRRGHRTFVGSRVHRPGDELEPRRRPSDAGRWAGRRAGRRVGRGCRGVDLRRLREGKKRSRRRGRNGRPRARRRRHRRRRRRRSLGPGGCRRSVLRCRGGRDARHRTSESGPCGPGRGDFSGDAGRGRRFSVGGLPGDDRMYVPIRKLRRRRRRCRWCCGCRRPHPGNGRRLGERPGVHHRSRLRPGERTADSGAATRPRRSSQWRETGPRAGRARRRDQRRGAPGGQAVAESQRVRQRHGATERAAQRWHGRLVLGGRRRSGPDRVLPPRILLPPRLQPQLRHQLCHRLRHLRLTRPD